MGQVRSRFYHSLYFRLAGIFLLGVSILGLIQLRLISDGTRRFFSQVNQGIERDVASEIANTIQPQLQNPITENDFREIIYPYWASNPKWEVFLIHADGEVFASVSKQPNLRGAKVDIAPIKTALRPILPSEVLWGSSPIERESMGSIVGIDTSRSVFSVAPIRFNNESGYLYIILEGTLYNTRIRQVGQFFLARILSFGGLLGLLSAIILSYFLFRALTKRFRYITDALTRYEQGDYSRPLEVSSKDEIGALSAALNEMSLKLIRAKAEIEERDARRRQLITLITHDLRSPLASIQGYLELISMNPKIESDSKIRTNVERSIYNAELQERLIDDLFELSKLEAQERSPDMEEISLVELVDHAVKKQIPRAKKSSIDLSLEVTGQKKIVLADELLLSRVFGNLIENAFRFTPEGGEISICVDYRETDVEVLVTDSGVGIDSAKKDVLVEMFSQENVIQNKDHKGSGLGLAIVQRILDLHDSRLQIHNTESGGACFGFRLITLGETDDYRQ